MRFFNAQIIILALFIGVVATTSANAQFREVTSDQPNETSALVPTKQPFVKPKIEAEPAEAAAVEDSSESADSGSQKAESKAAESKAAESKETESKETESKEAESKEAESKETESKETETKETETELSSSETDKISGVDPYKSFRITKKDGATAPSPSDQFHHSPVVFDGIEPGDTTVDELESEWGEPAKKIEMDEGAILVYSVEGFRQIDVFTDADEESVESILVHLNEPAEFDEIQQKLELSEFDRVIFNDDSETPIAYGIPEKGVLLTLDGSSASSLVAQISLEPIRGELFRLRAELDDEHQHSRSISDLDEAVRLDPKDAKAHWLLSELMSKVGRFDDALESGERALRLEPTNTLYRLTFARLAAEDGNIEAGIRDTQSVLDDPETTDIVKARAEYQLGNLIASGPDPVFEEAMAHHLKAVDLSVKHVNDKAAKVRRMAKNILVEAHIAVAQDIALGNFQKKSDVVPKWLTRAAQLGDDFIENDHGDETIRLRVYRSTLAIYAIMDEEFNAAIATEEALKEGKRLIASVDDKVYQSLIERELSEVLLHASKVEYSRGRPKTAMNFASNSVALLHSQASERQPSLFDEVMEGQLYFLMGSLYALTREDHQEAVSWYEKAAPSFTHENLPNLVDASQFGDLFVSMGVSYWQVGKKEKAVELTQAGAELIQQAVQVGALELDALAVPYGNLASMHKQLGNGGRAEHFAQMMARITKETETR